MVARLVGFGGSVAVVLEAARAIGASAAETSSRLAMLCLGIAIVSIVLSVRHRMPIVAAWSTPGAALIAAGEGVTMDAAIGAFLFSAGLVAVFAGLALLGPLVAALGRRQTLQEGLWSRPAFHGIAD